MDQPHTTQETKARPRAGQVGDDQLMMVSNNYRFNLAQAIDQEADLPSGFKCQRGAFASDFRCDHFFHRNPPPVQAFDPGGMMRLQPMQIP